MKNVNIVPKGFTRNKDKIEASGYTHMRCSKTDDVLPLSAFRLHKGKYYMPYNQKIESKLTKVKNLENSVKKDPNSILIKFDETNAVKAHFDKRRCTVMAYSNKSEILYFHNRYTSEKIIDAYKKYAKDTLNKNLYTKSIIIERGSK